MFRSDRILALNVGDSKIVLAEFDMRRSAGLELTSYAVAPLDVDPDTDADLPAHMVHTIRQVMRDKNIRGGPVLLSISGQLVFPRYVKLPPVAKDKIPQIVRYEAQQNVPFSIDEVVWDYQLTGTDGGELSVMLVAAKRELLQKLTDCVEAAGLEPEFVDVSPMALYNAARYNYPELDGCTMILDIGARTTNVVFAEGSRIFTRSIPVAGHAITKELMKEFNLSFKDAEDLKFTHSFVGFGGAHDDREGGVAYRVSRIARGVMTRLHAEVSRTINFYRSQQGGAQPAMVLLTGGSSIISHTNTFLRDKLKVDVDYLNPFRSVAVSDRIPSEEIGRSVQVLGEVVGLALRKTLTCPIEINLLPPALTAKKAFQRRLPFFGVAALALVMIMVVWWAYLLRMRAVTEERLASIRERVRELETLDSQLSEIQKQEQEILEKTRSLGDLVELRTRWIEILTALHDEMPEGMWLVSLKPVFGGEGGVAVTGVEVSGMGFADKINHEAISEFAGRVKKAQPFSEPVNIKSVKPVAGTDYVNEFVFEVALK